MDGPRTSSRTLRINQNGQWSMDSFFHNNWVLGGLAFFWLLGSVVLLVGVIATMKLAYLPALSKGFPSHVMGLTKKEALVMVSIAVTMHLLLLFLFLGMVFKERSHRNDNQVEGVPHEGANTEGNQWAEQDSGTIREKECDLPPCYDCLVGEETPPPPFHSVILRAAYSSNSLTSQCQETWPCLSSKHKTPDADKPTFEDIELADIRNIDVERTFSEQNDEDGTDDDNKPNREQNGETKDENVNAVMFNIEPPGMLDLETEDFVGPCVENSAVVSIETSNDDSDQSERDSYVQVFEDNNPDPDQGAFDEKEYAAADRTNFAQVASASGSVIADVAKLDLEQIDVKDIADADKTLLQHGRPVCSKFHTPSHMDDVNQAVLVDYTSQAACLSSEHFKSIENMRSYVKDSAVQDRAPVEYNGSSDDESVKQQIRECYPTPQNNNDRQFIYEESEASCLNETECNRKQPAEAVECCNQFTTLISGSQTSPLRYLKYNLDGSTRFLVHGSKVEIDDGSDKYGDDVSTNTVIESKCNLFNKPAEEPNINSEGLKEFDKIDSSTFIDEGGIVFDSANELFSVRHTDPSPKIDRVRLVRKQSIAIGEEGAICHCGTEACQASYFRKTKLHDVTCPTNNDISQTMNRNKRAEPCWSSYSSSLERQNLPTRTMKKGNSSLPHNTIFPLSGNRKSEYSFYTISDSLHRQKKSQVRELKCESFSSCNYYRESENSNFNSHFAPLHQTALLMTGKSTSEALGSTNLPAVERIDFYPSYYFSQMDINSEDISHFTDVLESRESGIQSSPSLVDSNDLFRCHHTTERSRQHGNLDSAVGSFGSIAMQSCASESCDDDESAKIERISYNQHC